MTNYRVIAFIDMFRSGVPRIDVWVVAGVCMAAVLGRIIGSICH